jgi:indoleamine 2,3-dioxygenase
MDSFQTWKSMYPDSWFSCRPGENGFLPIDQPLEKLPEEYEIINKILDDMKISQKSGENGLLFYGNLRREINEKLPLFDFSGVEDTQLLAALHRDYCFMAAAYSLEPSHLEILKKKDVYGKAENVLPEQLAVPLICLGKKNDVFPWLDYAYGYGLNNAILKGQDNKDHNSYKTVRTFNGIDSEEGFINVHVAMVSQTGNLLQYQQNCLKAVSENNREEFNNNLQKHFDIMYSIVNTLQTMWTASMYSDYLTFRTFIMGQIGNTICYPSEELIYNLGSSTKETQNYEVKKFRGETGAQDSIIPSVDNFLQLEYPQNKLTEYLFDLRKYRPKDHQEYINFVGKWSNSLGFKEYCLQDTSSSILLLKNLNCIRMFRKKHWNLTKKYIIESTKHPVATGGTPITTWLPNQLGATLEYMDQVVNSINPDTVEYLDREFYNTIKIELSDHIQTIMDEVKRLQSDFTQQQHNDFLKR